MPSAINRDKADNKPEASIIIFLLLLIIGSQSTWWLPSKRFVGAFGWAWPRSPESA